MVSPYPPGVPVLTPGEVITEQALTYLRSGAEAGMLLPDAADPTMETVRVMAGERRNGRPDPFGRTGAA